MWLYLTVARGKFWHLHDFDDDILKHDPPSTWPSVIAVVPARNEAASIAQALTSLLQQNYPGEFSVVLVDDHSEDATAQIARQTASELNAESRIAICTAAPLPANWTGKLWALNEGVSLAADRGDRARSRAESRELLPLTLAPNYFWFTDADVSHAPDTLHRLAARAERDHLDLASLMVLLQAKTLPERVLIPAFLFFFLKLYPPRWIANSRARTAGAAGGCILLRSEALQRIGGFAAIRGEVIDDCTLARAVKRGGGKVWMGLTRASVSHRAYNTFREIGDLIARTAFTQLRYSFPLLFGTLLAMFLLYLAPVALQFAHHPTERILGACAWLLMSLLYLPTMRFYRLSPVWAVTLPLTALFYSYATVLSAARFWLGRGAQWKGRFHPPPISRDIEK
jgi:hopene-associated glycosyltransferase HpnB